MAEGTGAGSRSKDTLKASMLEVFPGVVLHDRDLELCNADGATASRSPRAAFVGLDAEQRLVLVLHARDPDGESPALLCLDALAFASENASALAQHLGRPDLRTDAPARIVLVVSRLNPRLARRLCALHAEIEVCELRTLRTASSSARYLVPVALSSTQRIAACAPDAQSFAASLPQEQRELAERLLTRMSRVDEEIVATTAQDAIHWRFGHGSLARLEVSPVGLRGSAPPGGQECSIESEDDIESFLEEVMLQFARELGALDDAQPGAIGGHGFEADPLDDEPLSEGPLGDAEELGQLTKEELEAFL